MTTVGNYELVTQLASGGMAETHVARALADDRIVVVKQLLPEFAGNAEFIEMFIDEGRVISSLHHPNIVAMHEFGFHAELPFLAMEYLHGVDLRTLARTQVLRKKQAMPLDAALYIAISMCAGLHHAHEARTIDGKPMEIAHRDVSPQNVVITFDGAVKLIDFGIATARGRTHETRAGALKGKIPYMAPEQVRSMAADRRTDIYATGIVLYELLTKRRPYFGKQRRMSEFSLMMAIVNHDVVALDTVRLDLPPALSRVVGKAIALDPAQRYQTAAELQRELEAIASALGIPLGPERLVQMMSELIARRPPVGEPASPAQIAHLVSEVEVARTQVDERHDPSTIDRSEVGPAAADGGPAAPATASAEPDPDRAGGVIDKIVESDRTRLRFLREPEPGFRWVRMLDGVEGTVEIDFTGAVGLAAPSLSAAREALNGLGAEVDAIQLIGVPITLAGELSDRCQIVSTSCRGWCPTCKARRVAVLDYAEMRDRITAGREISCPHCHTPLGDIELGNPRAPTTPPPSAPATVRAVTPELSQPVVAAPSAPPTPRRRGLTIALTAIALSAIGCGVLWWQSQSQPRPQLSATGSSVPVPDPRAWTIEATGEGTTDIAVLTDARLRALALAVRHIEAALPAQLKPLCAEPPESLPAQLELEQLDATTQTANGRVHAVAHYRLTGTAADRAIGYYGHILSIWGFELANAPPSRRPGVLVVTAPAGSIVAGDRIISVAGHPLASLDTLQALGELRTLSTLGLVIEHQELRALDIPNRESPAP